MCELRPALASDFELFYGIRPAHTFTGVVAVEDGKALGIGGVIRIPSGGRIVSQAFMEMRPEAASRKKDIIRAARMVLAQMAVDNQYVYARADDLYPNSKTFLEHFGFTHREGLDDERLYIWQR
jgi:hypothetical protein